jgi:serine/threonine-protein kinase HipA
MIKVNREGYIYCNGSLAGLLQEFTDLKTESYRFIYNTDYLMNGVPIGHCFPLTDQPFEFDTFPTFFANLISEGWLRTHQAKKARLDKTDSFGLLLANGKELIGAMSVVPSEIKE